MNSEHVKGRAAAMQVNMTRFLSEIYSVKWHLLTRFCEDTRSFSLETPYNGSDNIDIGELNDIRQSQGGDSDAYRRLIERHQAHIGKLLWRFCRDRETHEELVQETFVQAYISLNSYRTKAPFEHWLTRIALRVGYHFWKQQKRHSHVSLQETDWQQFTENASEPTDPEQAGRMVHHLLALLKPRDRLILTLRYLEQCSVQETARRTGWSEAMVKVQTFRAKQKLKNILKNSDIETEIE